MQEASILKSIKLNLGLGEDSAPFDPQVITEINSALSTLTQIGLGPDEGFFIDSNEAVWGDFFQGSRAEINQIKSYVSLQVRNIFDPPTTSYVLEAFTKQNAELLSRLSMMRENREWEDPNPARMVTDE